MLSQPFPPTSHPSTHTCFMSLQPFGSEPPPPPPRLARDHHRPLELPSYRPTVCLPFQIPGWPSILQYVCNTRDDLAVKPTMALIVPTSLH